MLRRCVSLAATACARAPSRTSAPLQRRAMSTAAADKMSFSVTGDDIKPRPVPKSSQDYEAARRVYQDEVSKLRKVYKKQWDARREVEAAEAQEERRQVLLRKAETQRLKAIRKRKVALKHARSREAENKRAQADRNYRLAARRAYFAKVAHARQEWLRKLDEESKAWIPEDKIDEMINEETFAMTYPWHLEEWYARRQRRQQIQAARARGEKLSSDATVAAAGHDMASDPFVVLSHQREQDLRDAPQAATPDVMQLLRGDGSLFVPPPSPLGPTESTHEPSGPWESDDDMLDGFGSDWEEDVPMTNWFAKGERMSRTGIQLEELYFQESLMDIKRRLDAFEQAHDAKFPVPEESAADWAWKAMERQYGQYSEPGALADMEAEAVQAHAAEEAARKEVLDSIPDVVDEAEGDDK